MQLRTATLNDAAALSGLARQTFNETFHHYDADALVQFFSGHYSTDIFTSYIKDKHTQLWLAETNGQLVAYAKFGACGLPGVPDVFPAIELHRLYVLKAHHGQKIGAALMQKAFDAAQAQGAKAMYLGVWSGNINAQNFYRKYGFEKIGEYDYLPIGKAVDREWIMRKAL